jgi:hypothetical protein
VTIGQVAEPDAKRSVLASKIDSQQKGMAQDYVHNWPQQLRQQEKRRNRLSVMEALDVRLRLAWSGSCVCAAISVVV